MSHNLSLGKQGEGIACQYLEKKGYRIHERNWRSKIGEIDIVAEQRDVFVFVEVKTRSTSAFGYPEEAVTQKKKQHLIRTAALYNQTHHLFGPYRIDVIALTFGDTGEPLIVHIENITADGG